MFRKYAGQSIAFLLGASLEFTNWDIPYITYTLMGIAVIWAVYAWSPLGNTKDSLEIQVKPNRFLDESPYYSVIPGRSITAIFVCVCAEEKEC